MDKRCIYWFLFAILIRYQTSLHAHSGQATPPMYGDYEAQRHWQEITFNLPLGEWYVSSAHNNLTYWGLDYPPLTAYHSWLNGWLAAMHLNSSWVELNQSRGIETPPQKLFMRATVLVSDAVFFMLPLLLYFVSKPRDRALTREAHFLCAVLYPGFILIDHGHFQYNCVSLGFTLCALLAIEFGYDCFASIAFVLALNYKQMSLYHAMPFFCYFLGKCMRQKSRLKCLQNLVAIGITVMLTFAVIWLPFFQANGLDGLRAVLNRLFPVARGLYEDKVANFWCTFSPIFRFNRWPREVMLRLTMLTTIVALTTSSWDLLKRPSVIRLTYALLNSSLAFFLFSYQVHEKSILLVALPALLLFRLDPAMCMWLLITTIASMMPLLVLKDGLLIATVSTTVIYCVVAHWLASTEFALVDALPAIYSALPNMASGSVFLTPPSPGVATAAESFSARTPQLSSAAWRQLRLKLLKRQLMTMSFILLAILCCICTTLPPPKRFPDLYVVALSSCCCLHFLGFAVYFNWCQLNLGEHAKGAIASGPISDQEKERRNSSDDDGDDDDENNGSRTSSESDRLLLPTGRVDFRRRARAQTHAAVEWTRQDSLRLLPRKASHPE